MKSVSAVHRRIYCICFAAAFGIPASHAGAQQPDPRCQLRSAADTLRVVLRDSSARARWSAADLSNIRSHIACPGMSQDLLVSAWGLPRNIERTVPRIPGDTVAQFRYAETTAILVNGVLRTFRPNPRSE